ncbi:MAG: hypothetical protein L3K05_01060 [Thermoplasmata archaeon]|nr:hypothetical protein [Thermoplasmata archaeon]
MAVTRLAAGAHWPALTLFVTGRRDPSLANGAVPGPHMVRLRGVGDVAEASPPGARSEEGVRFPDLEGAERFASLEVQQGAGWISFPGSLIEARRVAGLVASLTKLGGRVLVTNPHADGRLGGPGEGLSSTATAGAPTPLASLERAYAPVLRLGFLTSGGRRTLPQAAVAFVLALPAIPSVRFADVRQLVEFGDPSRLLPIVPAEMARLLGPP